ncbi:Uncharacterised protein [Sphingobacterium daejeonense]|nr:Uncharacterised protein [Sphingobacterium daejeonense]
MSHLSESSEQAEVGHSPTFCPYCPAFGVLSILRGYSCGLWIILRCKRVYFAVCSDEIRFELIDFLRKLNNIFHIIDSLSTSSLNKISTLF